MFLICINNFYCYAVKFHDSLLLTDANFTWRGLFRSYFSSLRIQCILQRRTAEKYRFTDRVSAPSANIAVGANRWPNIGRVCWRISDSIGYFIPEQRRRYQRPRRRRETRRERIADGTARPGFIALAKRLTAERLAASASLARAASLELRCMPYGGTFDFSSDGTWLHFSRL